MTYRFVITKHFKRQVRRLNKKDRSVKDQLIEGLKSFAKERAVHMGRGVYKMRLGRANQGKSGGYRVYLLVVETEGILAPFCIYAKNEWETIPLGILADHLESVQAELVSHRQGGVFDAHGI